MHPVTACTEAGYLCASFYSCVEYLLQFARLAHLLSLLWAGALAVYWLITSAMLADLYERYCDRLEDSNLECGDTDEKFVVLPIFGFVCMGAWVSW